MIPIGILFAESFDGTFHSAPQTLSQLPGSLIHAVWYFMSFLLVAFFSALLRASLIKSELPGILRTYEDVVNSDRPIMLVVWSREELEFYERSDAAIGQYLAKKSTEVFAWAE